MALALHLHNSIITSIAYSIKTTPNLRKVSKHNYGVVLRCIKPTPNVYDLHNFVSCALWKTVPQLLVDAQRVLIFMVAAP